LAAGNAYRILIRGNRAFDLSSTSTTNTATTLRATGTILMGDLSFSSSGSTPSSLPTLASGANEYSFIGNPYPAPINWSALTRTELTSYYHIWDPNLGTRGAYVSVFTDGTTNNASSGATVQIQPGQAFFVQNSANVAARQLQIVENNKSAANNNTVFRNTNTYGKLQIQLFRTAGGVATTSQDGATVLFHDSFSNTVNDEDASKFLNPDENIAVEKNNRQLSIEQRGLPVQLDTIQLKTWQLTNTTYLLKIAAANLPATSSAFLRDGFTNTETAIANDGTVDIPFTTSTATASTLPDRFSIVFKSAATLPVTIVNLRAIEKNNVGKIEFTAQNEIDIQAYEVQKSTDGTVFQTIANIPATNAGVYLATDAQLQAGSNFYRVKSIAKNGQIKYTQAIHLKIGSLQESIHIISNPIVNNTLGIQFSQAKAGTYAITVFNSAGTQVATKTVQHAGGTSVQFLELPLLANTTYQCVVSLQGATILSKPFVTQ
jgi:hypothetical protein